ncbi:kinase-like protein [Hypoxylon sp. FL1150]|nr:kinase-like protein [Hypoxylon sp. FL1150]
MSLYANPLFFLKPLSNPAIDIVNEAANGGINNHLILLEPDGSPMFGIGHVASQSSTPGVLATLGSGDSVDIHLNNNSISKLQATFEINPQSKAILFVDQSPSQSSQVFGENVVPFEHGRLPRRVVVNGETNNKIGMGGSRRNLITFELIWHHEDDQAIGWIRDLNEVLNSHSHHSPPEIAPGNDNLGLSSRMETRIHSQQKRQMRYVVGGRLGGGNRGTVYKGMNLDTGDLMAVKTVSRLERSHSKKEIETLVRLKHPHIVDYIGADLTDSNTVIFMRLMDDNLLSLTSKRELQSYVFLNGLLEQMLKALDYLNCNGIIHGDVKPSNILYIKGSDSKYHFQLADFGLANRTSSRCGTHPYMAPEIFYGDAEISSKIDMWSLYMTVLCITNTEAWSAQRESPRVSDDYESNREDALKSFENVKLGYMKVLYLSQRAFKPYIEIQEMARINPERRASAAQMLAKCYGGRGLTTRSTIPAIPEPEDDIGILGRKHQHLMNKMEKRRLIKEWDLRSSDLLTSDGSDCDMDEMEDDTETQGSEDTIFWQMYAEMEKEVARQAVARQAMNRGQ